MGQQHAQGTSLQLVKPPTNHLPVNQCTHAPDTPFGAAPPAPGGSSGRNDAHSRPATPGFPSRDANGRLNG